ncbi:MAG: glycosyltransferase [Chlamydiales bacterium]|nr:glycosyltransferase [Chlamydiales bacterium]
MPTFTIAIPFYNDEAFLCEALKSCLQQDYQGSFEILLVNDGSSDSSLKIAKNFTCCFPDKVRLIDLEVNKGAGYARQVAVENAKGDYIVWADGDDLQHPNRLTSIDSFFQQYPDLDICLHDCYFINGAGSLLDKQLSWPQTFEQHPLYYEIRRNYFFVGFSAHKREIGVAFRSQCRDFPEDYDFILRALLKGKTLKLLPKKLSYYRIHGGNRSMRHQYTYKATKEILHELDVEQLSNKLRRSSYLREKEINLAVCELLMTKESFKEALAKLKQEKHDCFHAHFMKGVCHFFLGDNQSSASSFREAYSLDSSDPSVQNNLGVLQYKMGEVESALSFLKTALQNKPDYLDAQKNLRVVSKGKKPLLITKKPLRLSWVY